MAMAKSKGTRRAHAKRRKAAAPRKRKTRPVAGWREWIGLPDLGVDRIKAKIDTGARTSALHAFRIKPFRRAGERFVRFYVHPLQRRRKPEIRCEVPLLDERVVTSSNGTRERRYVIATRVKVGKRSWPIELTLTNRDEMSFRMLLGRQAVRRRLVVDPGSSFKLGKAKRKMAAGREET